MTISVKPELPENIRRVRPAPPPNYMVCEGQAVGCDVPSEATIPSVYVEVWPVGTNVRVGPDSPGIITALMVEGRDKHCHVTYRVVWFEKGTRYQEWLTALEFTPTKPAVSTRTIGFSRGGELCRTSS